MLQTVEAMIDSQGQIHWIEPMNFVQKQKVLVTFLKQTFTEDVSTFPLKNSITFENDIVSPISTNWDAEQ